MWKINAKVVPMVVPVGAVGAITPKLKERLQQIPGTTSELTVQKRALLETGKNLHITLKLPGPCWRRPKN